MVSKNYMRSEEQKRIAARNAVQRAVRLSRIPSAKCLFCECGNPASYYDHYAGYEVENWLVVKPVCMTCESRIRKERGETFWKYLIGPRLKDGHFVSSLARRGKEREMCVT
jgi:hypothetical protein